MIRLSDGFTVVSPCEVQGGSGPWAYYIGFHSDGLPEVGLEEDLRMSDSRCAGRHFNLSDGSDWLLVRGSPDGLSVVLLRELETHLGLVKAAASEEAE